MDVLGNGFDLIGAGGGVSFDFDGDSVAERVGWTAAGSDDAWLALDRDGNGRINGGRELFGNLTPQPPSGTPHGFLALAVFDGPEDGGNGDGVIDARDAIFVSLRLWRGVSHDGVCAPDELLSLTAAGIQSVSLDYRESRRRDAHGHLFRYRAKVYGDGGRDLGRWAYDVFLIPAP